MAEILKIIPKDVTASSNPAEAVAARSNNQSQERALNNTPVMPAEAVVQMAKTGLAAMEKQNLLSLSAIRTEQVPTTVMDLYVHYNSEFPKNPNMLSLNEYKINTPNRAVRVPFFSSIVDLCVDETKRAKRLKGNKIRLEKEALKYGTYEAENLRERESTGSRAESAVLGVAKKMINENKNMIGILVPPDHSRLDSQAVDLAFIKLRDGKTLDKKALRVLKVYVNILTNSDHLIQSSKKSFREQLKQEIIDNEEKQILNGQEKPDNEESLPVYSIPTITINDNLFLKDGIFSGVATPALNNILNNVSELKSIFDTLQEYFDLQGIDVKAGFYGFIKNIHIENQKRELNGKKKIETINANKIFWVCDEEGILDTSAIKQQLNIALNI